MDNVGKIINAHNKAKLQEENTAMDKCNCKQPNECPLSGNCLIDNIVYKATVYTAQGTPKSYIGYVKQISKEDSITTNYHSHTKTKNRLHSSANIYGH